MTKVVFPAFSGENFEPYEMRQLVSALELRFQSIEADNETQVSNDGTELDGRYSQVGHLHSESEITNLQNYLLNITAESIFDLSDVTGTPSINQMLQWNGTAFVPTSSSEASVALGDLSDVSIIAPVDGQVLTYVAGSLRWEAVGGSGGGGITSFAALTDTDLSAQAQYDLVFNADGVDWHDTAGKLQWNPTFKYLQLANAHSINWRDQSFATTELLQFDAESVSTLSWVSLTRLGATFMTTSPSWVPVTGFELTDLTIGDDYLLVSIPYMSGYISASYEQEFQLLHDGFLIPESDVWFKIWTTDQLRGRPFIFSKKITAAGDITARARCPSDDGQEHYVHAGSKLMAINLTELGASNYEYDEGAGFLDHIEPDVWRDTGVEVTFGDGAKDWLLFCSIHYQCNDGRELQMRLTNGTTHYPMVGYTPQSTDDEITVGGIVVMEAPASGTWRIESVQIQTWFANGVSFSSICAIEIDSLPSAYFNLTNPQTGDYHLERVIDSVSDTTINTTDYLAIAVSSGNKGASSMESTVLRYNVDGGADITIDDSFDVEVYNDGYQVINLGIVPEISAGSTLELEMYHEGNGITTDIRWSSVLLLQVSNAGPATEIFQVGDQGYTTRIDGLTTVLTSPTVEFRGSVTGVSYGGILEENLLDKTAAESITGLWSFDTDLTVSGTLDVDGAITAASYGGVLEANLLDKIAAEVITGQYTFEARVDIDDENSIAFNGATTGWLIEANEARVMLDIKAVDPYTTDYGIFFGSGGYLALGAGDAVIAGGTGTAAVDGDTIRNSIDILVENDIDTSYIAAQIGFYADSVFQFGSNVLDGDFTFYVKETSGPTWRFPFFVDVLDRGVWIQDLYDLKIGNAGSYGTRPTSFASLNHDGTDFNFQFTSTGNVDFQGMTNLRILAGGVLKIFDGTSADQIQIWHDGADAKFNFTGTTDLDFTGITAFNVVNYPFDVDQTVGSGQDGDVLTYLDGGGEITLVPKTYGGISITANAVVTTLNVSADVQVLHFDTNDPSNNTTPDHTNDHITIADAGDYFVMCSVAVKNAAGVGHIIHVEAVKNDGATTLSPVHAHRTLGSGTDTGSISLMGIVTLSASDTVELWAGTDSGTDRDVTFEDVALSVMKIK